MSTETSIRGWVKLAGHYGRSRATVRGWGQAGLPSELDGTTHVFETTQVDAWLSRRNVPEGDEDGELQAAQLRKLRLEVDRLEREKRNEVGLHAPADQFEQAMARTVTRVRQVLTGQFDGLLGRSGLPPADRERLRVQLQDGFDEVTDAALT